MGFGKFVRLAALAAILAGCGQERPESPTISGSNCTPQTAQIAVSDGYLQRLCGCQEAASTVATANEVLTCSVPRGTTVYFHYQSTLLMHQIVSNGTPGFQSSPLSDPKSPLLINFHPVRLDVVGTYGFEDAFNSAIAGQIIVY
ncbi:MAG: hypothetical protein A2428_05825 [Bdellovibrionales bacterium RIFOXYC1_FULL_54_43]|nr:MAG: hypothetical protein A2428_05825 [Bdellovibrionales bacterium RIFOXYC1_FULL_54_43]OFZ84551.1 MAG: hypothetical protein A2603_04390 [Bdellovibrionales bacterium RIFOXYD1_FULL_55_31]